MILFIYITHTLLRDDYTLYVYYFLYFNSRNTILYLIVNSMTRTKLKCISALLCIRALCQLSSF